MKHILKILLAIILAIAGYYAAYIWNYYGKIEIFCDEMRGRGMPKEECHFVVDYIQKNTNIFIRTEFNNVIIKKQDLKAHPSLLLPFLAAELEYKRLEK